MIRALLAPRMVMAVALAACATPARAIPPTQAQWDTAVERWHALRATFPAHAYTQNVQLVLREPITGKRFAGRGLVGVDPGHALRLVMIGPGGAISLDVWVTQEAWRISIPALSMIRRGGRESPTSMPIGFFRFWFLDPLGGRLLGLGDDGVMVVRDAVGGTSEVRIGVRSTAIRKSGEDKERFVWDARHAIYEHLRSGLHVDVDLGDKEPLPPEPAAFEDPDAKASP